VRLLWLLSGAMVIGTGFWAMQWMAMLGFSVPNTPIRYQLGEMGFAALFAIAGSAVAIVVLNRPKAGILWLWLAASTMAASLVAMKFACLQAMVMPVEWVYDYLGLAKAVPLPALFLLLGLYVHRLISARMENSLLPAAVGSVLVGMSGLAVHFATMGATRFYTLPDRIQVVGDADALPTPVLIPIIVISVVLLVGLYWLGALLDSRLGRAAQALADSEERHQAIISNMHDAVVLADESGTIISFNAAAERVFGYTADEAIGLPIDRLRGERTIAGGVENFSDPSTHQQKLFRAPRGGRRRDGSLFPVELSILPLRLRGRTLLCSITRDLTVEWERETEVRRLASAVEQSADAVAILDPQRQIVYVNTAYEQLTGIPRANAIGQQPGQAVQGDAETHAQIWDTVARTGVWRGRLQSRRRDGAPFHEELTLSAIRDAACEVIAYVAVMRDISRELEAEQERILLTQAVEQAADAIEVLDAQGRITFVNAAFEKRTGLRLAEIRGTRPEALADFDGDPTSYEEMSKMARSGRQWSGVLRSRNVLDRELEEEVTVSPIRNRHGNLTHFVVVKRDITEKRELENQLARAQRLESVGQLAAGIAREIDTPAQSIGERLHRLDGAFGAIDQLASELRGLSAQSAPVTPAALRELLSKAQLDSIAHEARAAITQSRDDIGDIEGMLAAMQDFSHPGQEMTAVDLNRSVQSTIIVAAHEWRRVAEIRTELAPDLPLVHCIPSDVNQAMLNLVVNAAHSIAEAAGDGSRDKGTITITTALVGDSAEIRISDTGAGITPEARAKLFDPAAKPQGTGRNAHDGLAFLHDIVVDRHGGTIALESAAGAGSTFIIRIPVKPPGRSLKRGYRAA
jgi:PAS domain S-box-containing protein